MKKNLIAAFLTVALLSICGYYGYRYYCVELVTDCYVTIDKPSLEYYADQFGISSSKASFEIQKLEGINDIDSAECHIKKHYIQNSVKCLAKANELLYSISKAPDVLKEAEMEANREYANQNYALIAITHTRARSPETIISKIEEEGMKLFDQKQYEEDFHVEIVYLPFVFPDIEGVIQLNVAYKKLLKRRL